MRIEKIKKFWKKEKINLIVLFIIILVASFLRLYNFEEWFHFRNDQARDAIMASRVIDNGIGNLRLLGPKAGGSALHLGPVFYYFQAFSSWIFQSKEPHIMAIPDLFFSILTIPLLYFFIRNFFSNKTSLAISAIYACSYVVVQYSRFAWNPNSLPFWSLLLVFSLYKISILKNKQRAGWFLVLASLAYAVASQLHFIAMLGMPLAVFIFWLKYFPKKINWKFWVGSILIIFILYIPFFVSEIITKGNNTQHFIHTVTQRSDDEKGFFKKINKTFENYGKYYSFFLTSINDNEVKNIYFLGKISILLSIIFLILVWKKKIIKIENKNKRMFLFLIFACFLAFIFINYKLSHEINKPRYWFVQLFVPFVFFGFLLDYFWKSKKRYFNIAGWFLVIIILVLNLTAILNIFLNFSNKADGEHFGRKTTSTTNRYYRLVPLSDMRKIADYIYENSSSDQKICLSSPSGYGASYQYLLELKHPEIEIIRRDSYISYEIRESHNLFLITNKERDKNKQRDILHMDFDIKNSFQVGNIRIYSVTPLDNELSDEYRLEYKRKQEVKRLEDLEKNEKKIETIPMKVWADFFNR